MLARVPDDPEDPDPPPPPEPTSMAVSVTVGTGDGEVVVGLGDGDALGAASSWVSSKSRLPTSASSMVKGRAVAPTGS